MRLKLPRDYYLNENVVEVSRGLIGKFLVTQITGKLTSGMIIETEAYNGVNDKASHAYNHRRTKRNEVMYAEGGMAYVYLCYGIHHLFNVVTNRENTPHAVLIRAIKPEEGIHTMLKRREKAEITKVFSDGPGTVTQALGITTRYSGEPLTGGTIWIEDRGVKIDKKNIRIGPRIGVDYAQEDAFLPYRFRLAENEFKKIEK